MTSCMPKLADVNVASIRKRLAAALARTAVPEDRQAIRDALEWLAKEDRN